MNRPRKPYLLVTGGGGGDGARLMTQVLAAYLSRAHVLPRALLVLGPLMPAGKRAEIFQQCNSMDDVDVIEFDNNMEHLIEGASAIVGMCGYNTFCEVLSFNKSALIVPRTNPREEQFIRANRAQELNLVDMMLPSEADDAVALSAALASLPGRALPESAGGGDMLNGLETINTFVSRWAAGRPAADLYAIAGAS